jgi:hypothetical protein
LNDDRKSCQQLTAFLPPIFNWTSIYLGPRVKIGFAATLRKK